MTNGLVSIITTTYNSSRYIADTILSIQAQSYHDWELLITDDCSTDETATIIEEYAKNDSRIKFYQLQTNGGSGISRNNSIAHAQGQYIAFCDSDDRWTEDKLKRQLDLMEKSGTSMCYSSYYKCDENGELIGRVFCKRRVSYKRMVCDNAIGFLTMIYDRNKLGTEYLPEIRKRQDWALNIKLLKKAGVACGVPEPLAYYRVRKGSLSRDKLSLIKYNIAVYEEVLGMSAFMACLKFMFSFVPCYFGKKFLNSVQNCLFRQS